MMSVTCAAPPGGAQVIAPPSPSVFLLAPGFSTSGIPAMILSRLLAGVLLLLACGWANAFDFRSVGPRPVMLYDGPSTRSAKRYVAPPGMPVQIVASYGAWVKVRDTDGDMAWTEAKGLSARRNVVVRAALARVRSVPDDNAAIVMTADKGVLLELVDPQAGDWVRIRHQDGIGGFVRADEVWGI
jgi:SH3-like domain-containing protein